MPFAAFAVVDELEQLLEHARGGPRSGHELHHPQSGRLFFIAFHGGIGLRRADNQHAVARRCGPHDIQERESAAEILQLGLRLFGSESVLPDLLQIFFVEHILLSFTWSPIAKPAVPPTFAPGIAAKKRSSASKDSSMQISHTIELFRFESQS